MKISRLHVALLGIVALNLCLPRVADGIVAQRESFWSERVDNGQRTRPSGPMVDFSDPMEWDEVLLRFEEFRELERRLKEDRQSVDIIEMPVGFDRYLFVILTRFLVIIIPLIALPVFFLLGVGVRDIFMVQAPYVVFFAFGLVDVIILVSSFVGLGAVIVLWFFLRKDTARQ